MPDSPLHPDELETYHTDVDTERDTPEPAGPSPASNPRPWILFGLGVLIVFVIAIAAAVWGAAA